MFAGREKSTEMGARQVSFGRASTDGTFIAYIHSVQSHVHLNCNGCSGEPDCQLEGYSIWLLLFVPPVLAV